VRAAADAESDSGSEDGSSDGESSESGAEEEVAPEGCPEGCDAVLYAKVTADSAHIMRCVASAGEACKLVLHGQL
jgi:hypothetical protein